MVEKTLKPSTLMMISSTITSILIWNYMFYVMWLMDFNFYKAFLLWIIVLISFVTLNIVIFKKLADNKSLKVCSMIGCWLFMVWIIICILLIKFA